MPTAIKRLMAKVVQNDSDCWLFTGSKTPQGYGRLNVGGVPVPTHRVAYEHFVGPIPPGHQIDHLCRVPSCCNPDHLEAVTPAENVRRGLLGALKTHCKNGHPWTDENKIRHGKGFECRECNRDRSRVRREERMADPVRQAAYLEYLRTYSRKIKEIA